MGPSSVLPNSARPAGPLLHPHPSPSATFQRHKQNGHLEVSSRRLRVPASPGGTDALLPAGALGTCGREEGVQGEGTWGGAGVCHTNKVPGGPCHLSPRTLENGFCQAWRYVLSPVSASWRSSDRPRPCRRPLNSPRASDSPSHSHSPRPHYLLPGLCRRGLPAALRASGLSRLPSVLLTAARLTF